MKKLLLLPLAALFLVVPATRVEANHIPPFPPGFPVLAFPLDPSINLKVDLCHNGTVIPISINAVGGLSADLNGHGLLTLNLLGQVVTFTKADGVGHSIDSVLRVYLKHGNQELNLDVEAGSCEQPPPPTTTTTLPPVQIPDVKCPDFKTSAELDAFLATLTAEVRAKVILNLDADKDGVLCENHKPVEKVVEKVVEKKVEVPGPTQVVEITRTVPVPVVVNSPTPNLVPKPAAPAPTGELPKTGGSPFLALMGGGVTALGVILRRLFR